MFDQEAYLDLLCSIAPKKIESEKQYDEYLHLVESLLFDSTRTKEQQMVEHILVLLIEEYEKKHYPIPQLEPLKFLTGLIENLELTFEDLVSIICDENLTKRILDGTYEIDKPIAKVLGEYFRVDYKHFL